VEVIACDDERSAELNKAAVSNIGEVYPGAKFLGDEVDSLLHKRAGENPKDAQAL